MVELAGGKRSTWRKPFLLTICPSHTSHDLNLDQTLATMVEIRRQTA
jgi:hypothetical protein